MQASLNAYSCIAKVVEAVVIEYKPSTLPALDSTTCAYHTDSAYCTRWH